MKLAPISYGELFDKFVILHIKAAKIQNEEKRKNILDEINILSVYVDGVHFELESEIWDRLYAVNDKIWNVQDQIRIKEKNKIFDDEFIEMARSVHHLNDERFKIKQEINQRYDSIIIEEKSYENS